MMNKKTQRQSEGKLQDFYGLVPLLYFSLFFIVTTNAIAQSPQQNDTTPAGTMLRTATVRAALELNYSCNEAGVEEPVGTKDKPEVMCEYVKFFAKARMFGPDGKLLIEKPFCAGKYLRLSAKKGTTGVLQIQGKGEYCVKIESVPFYEYVLPNKVNLSLIEAMKHGPADYGTFEFRVSWAYEIAPNGKIIIKEPLLPGEYTKFKKNITNNLLTVKALNFNILPVSQDNRFSAALEFGVNPNRNNPVKVSATQKGVGVEISVEVGQSEKYFVVGPVLDLDVLE